MMLDTNLGTILGANLDTNLENALDWQQLSATLTRGITMYPGRRLCAMVLMLGAPALAFAGKTRPCIAAGQAAQMLNKDICVSAHVYDVVQLPDGTRFLDVCSPQTTDDQCRFTVVSFQEDRSDVGELKKYRDADVQIRGIVQPMRGRSGMVLSHARQFYGGPPKFKANPLLARGFNAEQERPPVNDPNLRSQGGGRAFMNTKNQETLPGK
jgi:hypothetical protein